MNDLQILDYQSSPIRMIDRDGELWWVLADVCRVLDIKNSRDAASRLDDDEKGVALTDTPGGSQTMTTITKVGFTRLFFVQKSQKLKSLRVG